MNYEDDIKIDETALDVEWLEQPSLMMKYAQLAAEMRSEMDKAKEALELVKSELDKDIRSNPEKYGLEKITDKVVENTIPTQNDYRRASKRYLDAKFNSDIAFGAVKAVDARKDALENLVRLHGQQYFAGPKVPRDLSSETERRREKQKMVNQSIGSVLKRGR